MATYFTDFSEYTTGAQPSDWTRRWEANFTWEVQEDAGATGGKVLRWSLESPPTARNGLTWDAIDSDANRDDVEILAKVKFTSTLAEAEVMLVMRGSGAAGSENTYRHGPRPTVPRLETALYDAGSYVDIAWTGDPSYALNTWYWVRARVNGTTHQVKQWADGASEPGTWDIDTTDATISGVGWVGLLRFREEPAEVDVFGVGTNGDTAPSSDAAVTGRNVALNFATNTATTEAAV